MWPGPCDESNALTIWKPFEIDHTCGHFTRALGFTAIGWNQVELRLFVLLAVLRSLGHKGHPIALGRKLRAAVFVATLRELSGLTAKGRQQPDGAFNGIFFDRGLCDSTHHLRSVWADAWST